MIKKMSLTEKLLSYCCDYFVLFCLKITFVCTDHRYLREIGSSRQISLQKILFNKTRLLAAGAKRQQAGKAGGLGE
jgi:hypothetical protein